MQNYNLISILRDKKLTVDDKFYLIRRESFEQYLVVLVWSLLLGLVVGLFL